VGLPSRDITVQHVTILGGGARQILPATSLTRITRTMPMYARPIADHVIAMHVGPSIIECNDILSCGILSPGIL
jgi:hypothetical protein